MKYYSIIHEDKTHGEGLRCTLLVQGAKENSEDVAKEFINPNDGILFTERTQENIIEYIKSNDKIQGLSLAGGDPLYDANIDAIYQLVKVFRDVFKDTKDIWLYTEFQWEDFKYWKYIIEAGLHLGDKYITRLKIIKLIDVLHCKCVYSNSDYAVVDVKKSILQNKEIFKNNNLQNK